MNYIAKLISPTLIEIAEKPSDIDVLKSMEDDGFLEFIESQKPFEKENKRIELSYEIKNGKVYQVWIEIDDPNHLQKQIDKLKGTLASSDYKIIKCYEASLVGLEMPYDISSLHAERQSLRDEIGVLESQLANLF